MCLASASVVRREMNSRSISAARPKTVAAIRLCIEHGTIPPGQPTGGGIFDEVQGLQPVLVGIGQEPVALVIQILAVG